MFLKEGIHLASSVYISTVQIVNLVSWVKDNI